MTRQPARPAVAAPPAAPVSATVPALALVHHGHQYLVTDGYDNHEDLSEVLEGFATVLALHLKHRVPVNLHLSGTLIEAIAWHRPDFFGWVRALRQEGLVELLGSAYSQCILTLFRPEHVARQLNETLRLYRRHLGVEPGEVRGLWVPERVWNSDRLAPIVSDGRLDNGGYDWVLLDDRLAYAGGGAALSPGGPSDGGREQFDARAAPARAGGASRFDGSLAFAGGVHLQPWRLEVAGSRDLIVLPISAELRYCLPPRLPGDWGRLAEVMAATGTVGPAGLAVYADDLEKTAAVGPWGPRPWRRALVEPYERFLQRVAPSPRPGAGESPVARPVLVSAWLAGQPVSQTRVTSEGTFYELVARGAGEDYRGFWDNPGFARYRAMLEEAEGLLCREAPDADEGLWGLAWKQLMACSYETAWHEATPDGAMEPAPWARATAAHVRSVSALAAAARWRDDPRRTAGGPPVVVVVDVDGDGEAEVVLANEHCYAVVTPRFGARIIYLFQLEGAGHLVVGNPSDDWNWQEELNRFMAVPRNHPGALADVGFENDRHEMTAVHRGEGGAEVELVNTEPGSARRGSRKHLWLPTGARALTATYVLAGHPERAMVECALSPAYLSLLRHGRERVRPLQGGHRRGWRSPEAGVYVEVPAGEPVVWDAPAVHHCGHGFVVRVTAWRPQFSLRLGVDPPGRPFPPETE